MENDEGVPRLVLAIPAAGQESKTHEAAIRLLKRAFPELHIWNPHPSWDDFYLDLGARNMIMGSSALVFMSWRGWLSRGIWHMVKVSPRVIDVRGHVHFLHGGTLYRKWEIIEIPKEKRTKVHFARVRPRK